MSVIRAGLRVPIASRIVGRRFASVSAYIEPETAKALEPLALKDPRIPAGVKAYNLEFKPLEQYPPNDFIKRRLAVESHAASTTDLWRKISYYVCIPAIIVCAIYVYQLEQEHEAHLQHLIDENGGEAPERKVYSYMNIRNKPFPWGNQSLFHNPRYNITVEGP